MIFLKFKKTLMLLALALIFFETNCQAGRYNEFDEEPRSSRILRKLSNVFSYLFGDCIGDPAQYHYREISDHDEDNEIEELGDTESQPINILPNELLYQVAVFLSPPNIISLVKSNKKFYCLKSNNFWLYYNLENNYHSWNGELPAIKVAFSHYWFKNNKVRKAAAIGLPRARTFLKLQEELKRENPKSFEISRHSRKSPYEEFVYRKLSYGKHW